MKILLATDINSDPFYCEIEEACEIAYKHGHRVVSHKYAGGGKIVWNTVGDYDVGFGLYYQFLVPEKQLRNHKWINFHPGPLPMYGGRNLCYHALMNKEKEFGVTAHYMSKAFDKGPIIEKRSFPIHPSMNAGDLSKKCLEECRCLFLDIFKRICETEQLPESQLQGKRQRYYKLKPIKDIIEVNKETEKKIRAITTDKFPARLIINGKEYEIRPKLDESWE